MAPKLRLTALTVQVPASASNPPPRPHPPPKWWTPEFIVYYCVLLWALRALISSTVSLSNEQHPNYPYYRHKLSPGWIFDRKIDISDSQYRRFRLGMPQLGALAIGYILLSRLSRINQVPRPHFQTLASALILVAFHGTSVLKILLIAALNYWISRLALNGKVSVALVWAFNVGILFANDYCDGYRFRHLWRGLSFLDHGRLRGLIPRWQIGFNISMLRLISYGLDYRWAAQADFASNTSLAGESQNEKLRSNTSRIRSEYSFQNYFNYVFYPPLYIAGPILTFNNFVSQMKERPKTIDQGSLIAYATRFVVCFLVMEGILHHMYVVAIKDAKAWVGDSAFELSMVGFWNLNIVWLKLLIPWRFFRMWALLDGVDPPENMIRCMSNNFSALGFWRSWHRSYNLWIVRYIHIPLGGSQNALISTVVVFTFVALWHDLSFTLLTWGWLISVLVLPEILIRKAFANTPYTEKWYYRHLKALGGCFNVLTMMSANLVGFCLGLDGVKLMWSHIFGSLSGIVLLFQIIFVVFCAVQVMLEYREAEGRGGINRRC